MNRRRLYAVVLLSSIGSLGLPLAAMLVLEPSSYGAFSLFYLLGALANSLQLSVVSEAWVRSARGAWAEYISATIMVALGGSVIAAVLALITPEFSPYFWIVFLAVFGQVYWNGSRFHAFRELNWRYVLPGDFLGALATVVATTVFFLSPAVRLGDVLFWWAAVKWVSILASRPPKGLAVGKVLGWVSSHKREIRTLVADGAISDAASIGTPYALVPIVGVADLGTYRAVSNIGAPLRSLIAPLRPALTRIPLSMWGSPRLALKLVLLASGAGVVVWITLFGLEYVGLDLGTLNSLFPYAPAVGLYAFAMTLSTIYSLVARQVASNSSVIGTRTLVSIVAIVAPIVGAAVWGLSGAIWGYSLALCFAAVMWWSTVYRQIVRR